MADTTGASAAPASSGSASSVAPSSASSTSAPTQASTPASSDNTNASSQPSSNGEPPRERWDSILANARTKERQAAEQEYKQRYAKYDTFESDPWSAIQQWMKQAEGHSLYGPMVKDYVTKAAQAHAPKQEAIEPQADIPVVDGNGRVTHYTYSDAKLREWQKWNEGNLDKRFSERMAPLEEAYQTQRQQAEHRQMQDAAYNKARDILTPLRSQPYFKEHETHVLEALQAHPEWGDNVHAAFNHVLVHTILPTLSQAEQKQVLTDLQNQGAAATVAPSGTAVGTPKFKSFRTAAEYYSKHPAEMIEMANRR